MKQRIKEVKRRRQKIPRQLPFLLVAKRITSSMIVCLPLLACGFMNHLPIQQHKGYITHHFGNTIRDYHDNNSNSNSNKNSNSNSINNNNTGRIRKIRQNNISLSSSTQKSSEGGGSPSAIDGNPHHHQIVTQKMHNRSKTNNDNTNKNNNRQQELHQQQRPRKRQSKKQTVRTMFRQAKEMERTGQWREACNHFKKILDIDPHDSYSYLALGRLQSRRERGGGSSSSNKSNNSAHHHKNQDKSENHVVNQGGDEESSTMKTSKPEITPFIIFQSDPLSEARQVFHEGTEKCPDSIHLWQAWALHEESQGNVEFARNLFQRALDLDGTNPYVCHGYGLLEHRFGNFDVAMELWERPLKTKKAGNISAALVCSLGKLLAAKGESEKARDLYMANVSKIKSERETCEVYLAAAWLEEKHFLNITRAEELLHLSLQTSPDNSRASVALARLAGRKVDLERPNNSTSANDDVVRRRQIAVKKRLEDICYKMMNSKSATQKDRRKKSEVSDGRLFNAWADMEVKEGHYGKARKILIEGRNLFPNDHSLLQSAGKVEERVGNNTGARDFYGESLMLAPSAPTLVAYALLELRSPVGNECNYTRVERLFEEALLLDPRHGPVYNAYGNMELKHGNVERARRIYQNGVLAHCRDTSSVYHGLAMLELSMGNVETARLVLVKGLKEVKINDVMMDNNRRKRSKFLTHTLGMLELNSNRAAEAKIVFESGLERHVNSSQLLLGAALAEVKLGNENTARNLFERSVNVDRKHAQAWQGWGVMEMRAGNYKVAKTLFECGLKNDPKHGALWQAYATMESRLGNIDVARSLFATGVSKCPNHVPLYQAWACLEIRGENYEKAKIVIGEALTRDKSEGSGWLVAAKIEEKLGNEGLMIMILRRGLECAPNSADLYCAVADYEVNRGKIDLARELLERGLEMDPLHAPLYHSLAELEARVFNIQGLAELNKRAAQIFHNNALESPPITMNLLGSKLRKSAQSKKKLPNNINALAKKANSQRIDVEEAINDMDPDTIISNMMLLEDDIVADIFTENIDISDGD